MSAPPTCSACNYTISEEPPKAIHDPDGPAPSNPEGHIYINQGSKGPRFHCTDTGKMTSIVAGPDGDDSILTPNEYYEKLGIDLDGDEEEGGRDDQENSGSKSRSDSGQTAQNQAPQKRPRGLELEEDLEAIDLLEDVLDNPIYELSDMQIDEVLSWAEEFEDGMIPPDSLEELLGLLEGVSKQKAQLMRQKYEMKVQRWMRQRSEPNSGPPIGVMGRRRGPNPNNINISRGRSGTSSGGMSGVSGDVDTQEIDEDPERVIDRRRQKAQERVDEFADEFLSNFAANVGNDAGRFYSDMRNIIITALNKKAERDPDWVIEKLETFGGFELIDELMEPSDTKKREEATRQAQMEVDAEVDEVAAMIEGEEEPPPRQSHDTQQQKREQSQQRQEQQPQPSPESAQTNDSEPGQMENLIDDEDEVTDAPEEDDDEKEMFEETFGELTE